MKGEDAHATKARFTESRTYNKRSANKSMMKISFQSVVPDKLPIIKTNASQDRLKGSRVDGFEDGASQPLFLKKMHSKSVSQIMGLAAQTKEDQPPRGTIPISTIYEQRLRPFPPMNSTLAGFHPNERTIANSTSQNFRSGLSRGTITNQTLTGFFGKDEQLNTQPTEGGNSLFLRTGYRAHGLQKLRQQQFIKRRQATLSIELQQCISYGLPASSSGGAYDDGQEAETAEVSLARAVTPKARANLRTTQTKKNWRGQPSRQTNGQTPDKMHIWDPIMSSLAAEERRTNYNRDGSLESDDRTVDNQSLEQLLDKRFSMQRITQADTNKHAIQNESRESGYQDYSCLNLTAQMQQTVKGPIYPRFPVGSLPTKPGDRIKKRPRNPDVLKYPVGTTFLSSHLNDYYLGPASFVRAASPKKMHRPKPLAEVSQDIETSYIPQFKFMIYSRTRSLLPLSPSRHSPSRRSPSKLSPTNRQGNSNDSWQDPDFTDEFEPDFRVLGVECVRGAVRVLKRKGWIDAQQKTQWINDGYSCYRSYWMDYVRRLACQDDLFPDEVQEPIQDETSATVRHSTGVGYFRKKGIDYRLPEHVINMVRGPRVAHPRELEDTKLRVERDLGLNLTRSGLIPTEPDTEDPSLPQMDSVFTVYTKVLMDLLLERREFGNENCCEHFVQL